MFVVDFYNANFESPCCPKLWRHFTITSAEAAPANDRAEFAFCEDKHLEVILIFETKNTV